MNEQQHEYCKDDKKQRMNDEYRYRIIEIYNF